MTRGEVLASYERYVRQPLAFSHELKRYFDDRAPLVIVEVGACEGEDTIRLSRRFPNAVIHAFEPLPWNVARLRANLERYDVTNVEVSRLALSDRNGTAELYVSSGHPEGIPKTKEWTFGNKSSSLLRPKEHTRVRPWVRFDRTMRIDTRRLDTICAERSIRRIDFLYMDVQGAELMVLNGAGALLDTIGAIWLEVEAVELYKGQPLEYDVERFMRGYGFVCVMDTVGETAGDRLYVNGALES